MSFCKFNNEYNEKSYTIIDNLFFTRYLPSTPAELVNIYLYGLYLCNNSSSEYQDITTFATALNYSTDEIRKGFEYWQEQGLVKIVSNEPFEIQYIPIKDINRTTKKFNIGKYDEFNKAIQNIFTDRMLSPNELEEYYCLLEGFALPDGRQISQDALLAIVQYCVQLKGQKINYRYVITVARSWAKDGIISLENVENHIEQLTKANDNIKDIAFALGAKRTAGLNEQDLYIKWTQNYGFNTQELLNIAKLHKGKSLEMFDSVLQNYYKLHFFSIKEIENYEANKDNWYKLAKLINKNIGVYYESLETEVQTYIIPWLDKGFSPDCLNIISKYCFKKNFRTLGSLDNFIDKLLNIGVVTIDSFNQYLERTEKLDKEITTLLSQCGLNRNVTEQDREIYKRWLISWNMPKDVILYGATLAKDKTLPMAYLGKILAEWHNKGITTLKDAQKESTTTSTKDKATNLQEREYDNNDWDALFNNIKEIEI